MCVSTGLVRGLPLYLSHHYLSQLTRMYAQHRIKDHVSAVRNSADNSGPVVPRHFY